MYDITKRYTGVPSIQVLVEGEPVEIPTRLLVRETYCDKGVYWKYGEDIQIGEENGVPFWTLDPTMGRFEYRVEEDGSIRLCDTITIPSTEGLKYDNITFLRVEDLIMYFYLHNEFTRTPSDMTFVFGCRKYGDELIRLSP